MDTIFKVETKLSLIKYVAMVNEIVLEFFNEDLVYQPHIGMLNAMRLFYNQCVIESKYDDKIGHDVFDATDMVEIVADEQFITHFNKALNVGSTVDLDFGNAYKDAMRIVEFRKSSFGNAIETVSGMISKLIKQASSVLSEDNVEKISKIAQSMDRGEVTADAIVKAYADHMEHGDVS